MLEALVHLGGRATTDDLRAFPRDGSRETRDVKLVALRISVTGSYDQLTRIYNAIR